MSELAERTRLAQERIRPHVRETPLEPSRFLEDELGARLWLKCEHLQHTGSFKVRGALNKLLVLESQGPLPELVAASTGNHAAAVAYAASIVGARVTVFVPAGASPEKLARAEGLGARIEHHGTDGVEAELRARTWAAEHDAVYVSPYNDLDVVAGQGTLARELVRQAPPLAAVFCAMGGGGLAAGIAGTLAELSPTTRVYAASPEPSAVLIHSLAAGKILDLPSGATISDGTAGGVEPNAVTFPLVRELVDTTVVVPEELARRTLREYLRAREAPIEGAAAVALAACRMHANAFPRGDVAVVLCGGNLDRATRATIDPRG